MHTQKATCQSLRSTFLPKMYTFSDSKCVNIHAFTYKTYQNVKKNAFNVSQNHSHLVSRGLFFFLAVYTFHFTQHTVHWP